MIHIPFQFHIWVQNSLLLWCFWTTNFQNQIHSVSYLINLSFVKRATSVLKPFALSLIWSIPDVYQIHDLPSTNFYKMDRDTTFVWDLKSCSSFLLLSSYMYIYVHTITEKCFYFKVQDEVQGVHIHLLMYSWDLPWYRSLQRVAISHKTSPKVYTSICLCIHKTYHDIDPCSV